MQQHSFKNVYIITFLFRLIHWSSKLIITHFSLHISTALLYIYIHTFTHLYKNEHITSNKIRVKRVMPSIKNFIDLTLTCQNIYVFIYNYTYTYSLTHTWTIMQANKQWKSRSAISSKSQLQAAARRLRNCNLPTELTFWFGIIKWKINK